MQEVSVRKIKWFFSQTFLGFTHLGYLQQHYLRQQYPEMLSDREDIWRWRFFRSLQELSEGARCANSALQSCVVSCEIWHKHRNQPADAHDTIRPRYVPHFRCMWISSEAYILPELAERGQASVHPCLHVSAGTASPCPPGAHIAGGRTCPSAFKQADFLFPAWSMICLLWPL